MGEAKGAGPEQKGAELKGGGALAKWAWPYRTIFQNSLRAHVRGLRSAQGAAQLAQSAQ